jgi:hypothetical protein
VERRADDGHGGTGRARRRMPLDQRQHGLLPARREQLAVVAAHERRLDAVLTTFIHS